MSTDTRESTRIHQRQQPTAQHRHRNRQHRQQPKRRCRGMKRRCRGMVMDLQEIKQHIKQQIKLPKMELPNTPTCLPHPLHIPFLQLLARSQTNPLPPSPPLIWWMVGQTRCRTPRQSVPRQAGWVLRVSGVLWRELRVGGLGVGGLGFESCCHCFGVESCCRLASALLSELLVCCECRLLAHLLTNMTHI